MVKLLNTKDKEKFWKQSGQGDLLHTEQQQYKW